MENPFVPTPSPCPEPGVDTSPTVFPKSQLQHSCGGAKLWCWSFETPSIARQLRLLLSFAQIQEDTTQLQDETGPPLTLSRQWNLEYLSQDVQNQFSALTHACTDGEGGGKHRKK